MSGKFPSGCENDAAAISAQKSAVAGLSLRSGVRLGGPGLIALIYPGNGGNSVTMPRGGGGG